MNTPLRIAFAATALALLAGCGAKGPLFLPTKAAPVEVPATPPTETPAAEPAPAEQPPAAPATDASAPATTPPSTPDANR